jgi:hypothetical protein
MLGCGCPRRCSCRCRKAAIAHRLTLRAALVLACAALSTGLLAACGDADDESGGAAAASTLAQTFDATSSLRNAQLSASFQLDPEGLLALGGPLAFRGSGPFAAGAKGELPRFDLAIAGSIARKALRARAISTGKQGFLTIDGRSYKLDRDIVDALRSSLAASPGTAHGSGLATLGLDPRGWVKDARSNGRATIGGVETNRVSGAIDVGALLADVARLLGGAGGMDGLLTPQLRKQIEGAVTATKVDVWSGAQDKILRQLAVVVDFAFKHGAPVTGLDGGRITLRVRLDRVNATTLDPVAPKHARPLSDLTGDGGLGALLSGLGAGALGTSGGGDGGAAFLKCLTAAGATTADIMACTSKLTPGPPKP